MKILMDSRESSETKEILDLFLKAEEKTLLTGDIIVDDALCIEHKKIDDFISSVFDGRLFTQISKMQANYQYSYIMVSGSMGDLLTLANDNNCYNPIKAAIGSCYVRNCPIIFCDNLINMCEIIKILGEKLLDGKSRTIPIINIPIEHEQLRLLCSISGISEIIGQRLLDRFESPAGVFEASREGLLRIKGIGDKTVDQIWKVLGE